MNGLVHQPYSKFKGWLRENNLTYSDIASDLGLNVATVTLKINGQSDFYLSEIQILKHKHNLDTEIFLNRSLL